MLGLSIKEKFRSTVTGIEINEKAAKIALSRIDHVVCGSIEYVLENNLLSNKSFDCIVFGDILEHLIDPWSVLKITQSYLESGGYVLASIPNIRYYDTFIQLFFLGKWPYRERGIHDKTHLRYFTKKNIIQLFGEAGLDIIDISANYRLIERPHGINRYAHFLAIPGLREFLAYQYIVKAKNI